MADHERPETCETKRDNNLSFVNEEVKLRAPPRRIRRSSTRKPGRKAKRSDQEVMNPAGTPNNCKHEGADANEDNAFNGKSEPKEHEHPAKLEEHYTERPRDVDELPREETQQGLIMTDQPSKDENKITKVKQEPVNQSVEISETIEQNESIDFTCMEKVYDFGEGDVNMGNSMNSSAQGREERSITIKKSKEIKESSLSGTEITITQGILSTENGNVKPNVQVTVIASKDVESFCWVDNSSVLHDKSTNRDTEPVCTRSVNSSELSERLVKDSSMKTYQQYAGSACPDSTLIEEDTCVNNSEPRQVPGTLPGQECYGNDSIALTASSVNPSLNLAPITNNQSSLFDPPVSKSNCQMLSVDNCPVSNDKESNTRGTVCQSISGDSIRSDNSGNLQTVKSLPELYVESPTVSESLRNEAVSVSTPYERFDNTDTECGLSTGTDEEYLSDTDSDAESFYSDFTSSEGEYNMEYAEKIWGVGEPDEDDNNKSLQCRNSTGNTSEVDTIKEILSIFPNTEYLSVTDDTDRDSFHGESHRGSLQQERQHRKSWHIDDSADVSCHGDVFQGTCSSQICEEGKQELLRRCQNGKGEDDVFVEPVHVTSLQDIEYRNGLPHSANDRNISLEKTEGSLHFPQNNGTTLSEEGANSLKKKIGSFKIVEKIEPLESNDEVKAADILRNRSLKKDDDMPITDGNKAEKAIENVHQECFKDALKRAKNKDCGSGTGLERLKEPCDDVFINERSDSPLKPVSRIGSHSSFQSKEGTLEISRERYADGSPRIRSKSEGDIDDLDITELTCIYYRKQNTLPVRVTSLKNVDVVEENTLIRKSSWKWLPKPLNLEESRERRDSGSPLIKIGSKISTLQMGDESECHMDIDGNSTNKVKTSELLRRQELPEGKMSSEVADGFSEKGSLGLTDLGSNEVEPISGFETRMEANRVSELPRELLKVSDSIRTQRPLSTVREESLTSLDLTSVASSHAQNIPCADSEGSVDQHRTTETKLSLDDSSKTPDESKPRSSFKAKVVYEGEIHVGKGGSSVDIEENARHELKQKPSSETPTLERERLGNENDASIPKSAPSALNTDFESPSPISSSSDKNDSNKVNMRGNKFNQLRRKLISFSAIGIGGSTITEDDLGVQLRSYEKFTPDQLDSVSPHQRNSAGSPDKEISENLNQTGSSDKQSSESLDCENTTPDVVKDDTQQVAEGNEGSPQRPPRKKLVHSRSFNSPDTQHKAAVKRNKKVRRDLSSFRFKTLSGGIDVAHGELFKLPRLSTAKPPVELKHEGPVTLVTDKLPAMFPNFPTDKRAQVALELYTTERTYVRGLETVIELFKMPLEEYLDPKELKTMFSNIYGIFQLNKDVVFSLCERITHWKKEQCVGDIFSDMASKFKIYAAYCNSYEAAESLIKQKIKKKKEFEAFLNTCYNDPVCQPGLTLPAYLITVIQRIPRYLLLLRDLIKYTPPGHPDSRNLKEGFMKMNNIAEYINNQLQTVQGQRAMVELRSRVIGIKAFEVQGRSLFKEGEVFLTSTKKKYKCLLFNDLLVFAAKNVTKQAEVELTLELKTLWVTDLEDNDPQTSKEDAIEVYTPEQSYTMYTGSLKQKNLWLHKLRTAIAILLHGDEATDSYDITHRKAAFTYKDGRIFCGSFIDGKCNGHGVLAWQNRTRYMGNFEDDERNGIGELTYSTGEKYNGQWLDDRQYGVGTLTFPSGDLYTGEWQAGRMHGKGLIEFSNKDLVDGEFVDGEINGLGNLKCANGLTYKGTWQNSMKHGTGKLMRPNGDVYNGEFCDDQIHGQGEMVYARNKATYSGQWENNQRDGLGTYRTPDGMLYEGEWSGDNIQGKGKMIYPNTDCYDGTWFRSMRFGKGDYQTRDGLYEGPFEYDVRHGFGLMRYTDGSHYQGEWQNDQRHGQGKMIYADLGVYEGCWFHNLRHGKGKMSYPDGATYDGNWELDSEHGPDGVLSDPVMTYTYQGEWLHGRREGRGTETTLYGTYEGEFKASTRHGRGRETLKCRTVFEGQWKDGRKHGEGTKKTSSGAVEKQQWKDGQLVDKEESVAPDLPLVQRR